MSAFRAQEPWCRCPEAGGYLPLRKIDGTRHLVAIPLGSCFTEATFLEGIACALSARFARQLPLRVVPYSHVCVGEALNRMLKPSDR